MRSPLDYSNILVTGGSGQLGSEWSRFLSSRQCNHLVPSRSELDLSDPSSINGYLTLARPDFVIHCGAYTKVDQAEDEPEKANIVNHLSIGVIAEYCRVNDVPMIHYSTDYVFGETDSDAIDIMVGFSPDARTFPLGVYGRSKLDGEKLLQSILRDALIIRVSWLCGPTGHNFVRTMLRLSESNSQVNVVDDQKGSPTFTFDVVDISEQLARKGVVGVRHVSSSGVISWAEFAEKIFAMSGRECTVNRISSSEFKTKAKRPLYSKLDCRLTETEIGATMPEWEQSLSKLLQKLQ